ncbi:UNVERIFIED_ORG: hypothetical protein ABIB52_003386 [Arthrobacter sp. UYCu721]
MVTAISELGRAISSQRVTLFSVLGVLTCVFLATYQGFLGILAAMVIALVMAFVMPIPVTVLSMAWVFLVRPNTKLLNTAVAGFSISEVDLLLLLALVASCRIPRKLGAPEIRSRVGDWAPILAWPTWLLARAGLPQLGNVLFASPLVDLRILTAFLAIIPLWVLASRRGGDALLKLICYSAYIACAIAVAAWSLLKLGLISAGSYPLVNIASGAAHDVRPGGEILIPVLALLLIFNKAPIVLGNKLASFALLIGEILVSQTLSIVIATAAGISVALLLNWNNVSLIRRALIVFLLVGSAFSALAGGGASGTGDADINSRFNLSQRLGQTSAQYRVSETATLGGIYREEPLVLIIGTGPGSLISFNDGVVNEVKDLTHNVYNNLVLKSGILGAILFFGGLLACIARLIPRADVLGRSLAGSFAAIAVLSTTVPFASTITGLTAVLGIATLAVWIAVHARSSPSEMSADE